MLRCPKCRSELRDSSQKCHCGFQMYKDPIFLLSPLSTTFTAEIKKHLTASLPKVVHGAEIRYKNGEKYVGDVKAGKRHGVGELYHPSGDCDEGVWIEDVYSEKLSNFRNSFSLEGRELGDQFWDAFDLNHLSSQDKDRISKRIKDEQSILVGRRLGIGVTDAELVEFEKLSNLDEAAVWLDKHCPDFRT